jgi:ketosteroid isomerase-like protein
MIHEAVVSRCCIYSAVIFIQCDPSFSGSYQGQKHRTRRSANPPASRSLISRLISAGSSGTPPYMSEQDDILAANAAYYEAFASADFGKMSHIWANDEVTCVHPGWPVLIGRPAILESYRNIFSNPNQDRIEPHNAIAMVRGDEGRVICVELIGGNTLALAATNWFRRVDGAWRMIHHQASPIAAAVGVAAPQPHGRRLN